MGLPIESPAHSIKISPEALEIANTYLNTQNIQETAATMGIPVDIVSETLDKREVRAYIDNIFLDVGFNNRFKVRQVMDAIISKKLEELDDADVGSSKDIADLLALSHKMSMDVLDRQIQLEKIRTSNGPKNQTNVQINEIGVPEGSKYGALLQKLLGN